MISHLLLCWLAGNTAWSHTANNAP